jgi:PAS domain S-box-containing protein
MGNHSKIVDILKDFTTTSSYFFITYLDHNNNQNNFYSDNLKSVTGYSSEEIENLPEKFYSLVHEEDYNSVKKYLTDLELDNSLNNTEITYRILTKNGKDIWLKELSRITRDAHGIISNRQSLLIDITSIRKNELLLDKNISSLKELNTAKDKFISIITHDLRAPFTTLLGFSEILLNEKDLTDDEKNEYIKYIYDASKTQLNLINCLLDWSRLQTGRIKIEPTRLNVKSIIGNAIAPLTGDAVRKNIDVKIDIPEDLYINADERLINQAILNIASNAIKFTPEGKEVHIYSQRFKEGLIEIVVKDEGLGISEENQSKLFKIDQKFVLAGTNGEKGSGLGLTLMKEIVEKHGGHVWFYSKEGEGSEFHFTVPEAKNLVLIVEDELPVQELYKKVISQHLKNMEVKTVANGYEAISLLKDFIPALIITDHDMPLMNGIQLVDALYKRESNRTIPVIVVSAKLNDEISRTYSKLGVHKILQKPINPEMLIEFIQECLY